jgi:WD40 repeat protein
MGGKQSSSKRGNVTKTSYKGALVDTMAGHKSDVLCCAFSPNGKYLATSSADHSVMIWDVPSFRRRHRLENEHSHTDAVTAISFSPNSTLLVSGK